MHHAFAIFVGSQRLLLIEATEQHWTPPLRHTPISSAESLQHRFSLQLNAHLSPTHPPGHSHHNPTGAVAKEDLFCKLLSHLGLSSDAWTQNKFGVCTPSTNFWDSFPGGSIQTARIRCLILTTNVWNSSIAKTWWGKSGSSAGMLYSSCALTGLYKFAFSPFVSMNFSSFSVFAIEQWDGYHTANQYVFVSLSVRWSQALCSTPVLCLYHFLSFSIFFSGSWAPGSLLRIWITSSRLTWQTTPLSLMGGDEDKWLRDPVFAPFSPFWPLTSSNCIQLQLLSRCLSHVPPYHSKLMPTG